MALPLVFALLAALLPGCGRAPADAPPTDVPASVVEVRVDVETEPGQSPLAGVSIGIDPGHQAKKNSDKEPNAPGSDVLKNKVSAGATGTVSGVREYVINLEVGLRLKALLEKAGAIVVMTRTTHDVDISNAERAELMNRADVDLVLRLHCNGAEDAERRGAYVLVPTADRTAYYERNLRAAECILTGYCEKTGIAATANRISERDDQTGFNWCTRPVVNIEMGYLSNADDDRLLSDESFWDTMAAGLFEGLEQAFTPVS